MADRTITAVYLAKVDGYLAGVAQMRKENQAFRNDLTKSATQNKADWDKIGGTALKAGAASAAGLALVSKAAVDWESAWAGVKKTVDGTDAQMAQLEGSLRGLAKTLPATHEDIAAVAEAAGQLGVKREDVAAFTKTMIDLGESTNLSADEAATSIAQISNVMGTMDREGTKGIERFGSALVDLGNKGASTEKDILAMSSRIAGAAKVVGMTEADMLGLSNALASVGIEAEAGGSAVSKVLMDMSKAAAQGGEKLEAFAKVAGMSGDAFAGLFKKAPAEAMAAFTKGLDGIRKSGGDVFTTLDDLDLKEIRTTTALLKMAGASDMVTQSLQDGRDAWAKNNALTDEAAKRYETTASQLAIARNNVKDAAIDFGTVLLPAIRSASEGLRDFAAFMADLPGPVKEVGVYLAAAGTAVLLLGGGAIKATTSILEMKAAMAAAEIPAGGLTRSMNAAGRGAAALAKGIAAVGIAMQATRFMDGPSEMGTQQLTRDLLSSANAVDALNKSVKGASSDSWVVSSRVKEFGDVLKYSFDPSILDHVDGMFGSIQSFFTGQDFSDIGVAGDRLKELDTTLASMAASGSADKAAEAFRQIAAAAKAQGIDVEELKKKFPQYAEALAAAEVQSTSTKGKIDEIGAAAQGAQVDINELSKAIKGFGSAALSAEAAESAFQDAIDKAAASITSHGATLDLDTEAGRANSAALRDLASDTLANSAATLEMTGSIDAATGKVQVGRDAFIAAATQMGLTGDEAKQLADKYGLIPENVATNVTVTGVDDANGKVSRLVSLIDQVRAMNGTMATVGVRYVVEGRLPNGGVSYGGGSTAADGGVFSLAQGRLVKAYASGGIASIGAQQPQIRPAGGAGILWAEDGAGPWEGFVSGHPAKRGRSRSISEDIVGRLGGTVLWGQPRAFADGALMARPSSRSVASSAPALDPRALASAVSAALEGARLELTGVDRITGHMSARLVGAIGRV